MLSRLKRLFRRDDREDDKREKPEVHTRERTDAELRAEAQHYAHGHHGNLGGGGGFAGGGS